MPAGGSLQVALASDASSGATALYVSQGHPAYSLQLPGSCRRRQSAQPDGHASRRFQRRGIYYILAESVSGAAATAGYTLTATQTAAVAMSGIAPSIPAATPATSPSKSTAPTSLPSATASLTGGTTINASAVDFVSASQIFATFNLDRAPRVGNYTLKVQQTQQGVPQSATELTPFQVVAAVTGSLNVTRASRRPFVPAGPPASSSITPTRPTTTWSPRF